MASASKSTSTTSTPRRKSSAAKEKSSMIITLKLSPQKLRGVGQPLIKENSLLKDSTSTIPNTLPVATSQNGVAPSKLNPTPNTPAPAPAPNGIATPLPSSMPPPTEAIKKKGGTKRSSTAALGTDTTPRVRGKPGPKKKARMDDGTIDPTGNTPRASNGNGTHKLGPKANQGAINAGLRALDRSGKPCRKWEKRSFIIKTFTGIPIEISRWRAPPKVILNHSTEGSSTSDSSKENKDNSQVESEKSNTAMDVDNATHPTGSPAPQTEAPAPAPADAQPQPQPTVITASA